MSDRIRPFANGTEYALWQEHNCCRCKRCDWDKLALTGWDTGCELENALSYGSGSDGTISAEIARRLGYSESEGWTCAERQV